MDSTDEITVHVRYFAGARAAAEVAEESVSMHRGASVRETLALLADRRGAGLARVLSACSFLVDGVAVTNRERPLTEAVVLDVLPPFAGG
ncbi:MULTISPECIES: MoaD/ThiS family protein [Actinoalloteichus]|uniref:Molybdopterin converting factor, small subunit n=1 Tax=Actinoalloteichus fjordicus TaxID=1612552 RepID=A0AAC9LH46_9PSEU|nr:MULTISPECIES: MoaD/ThiS family protein [Actinoalloteichus]APU17683.1 molybdopterin converting factor, small subunit [Actinoalloteichus fjordicus]APU23760.1 molybdopterin converting factor, small subunit [Actinoalloteichus sp. GBA129-24]